MHPLATTNVYRKYCSSRNKDVSTIYFYIHLSKLWEPNPEAIRMKHPGHFRDESRFF